MTTITRIKSADTITYTATINDTEDTDLVSWSVTRGTGEMED